MKKIAILLATGALVFGAGAAPSQAVSCSAFNKGTATAAHDGKGKIGQGIVKIAMACHGIG